MTLCKLDLKSGYHQIWICYEDVPKIVFHTLEGHHEFQVIHLGTTNALSSFQPLMNTIIKCINGQNVALVVGVGTLRARNVSTRECKWTPCAS